MLHNPREYNASLLPRTQAVGLQRFYLQVKVIACHKRQCYHVSRSLSAVHLLCRDSVQDPEICFGKTYHEDGNVSLVSLPRQMQLR